MEQHSPIICRVTAIFAPRKVTRMRTQLSWNESDFLPLMILCACACSNPPSGGGGHDRKRSCPLLLTIEPDITSHPDSRRTTSLHLSRRPSAQCPVPSLPPAQPSPAQPRRPPAARKQIERATKQGRKPQRLPTIGSGSNLATWTWTWNGQIHLPGEEDRIRQSGNQAIRQPGNQASGCPPPPTRPRDHA